MVWAAVGSKGPWGHRARNGTWQGGWRAVSGFGWWKKSLSACVLRAGQERPVFTGRINNGLGESQSWSGHWGEVIPPDPSPSSPQVLLGDWAWHTNSQTRAFRKQLLLEVVALPIPQGTWVRDMAPCPCSAARGPPRGWCRPSPGATGFPAPRPCLRVGPTGFLLEGEAEDPMGWRQSPSAGLSKTRAVRRWKGLSEGSEFSSTNVF